MSADQASTAMGIISHHTAGGFEGWKTFYKSPFLQTKHTTPQAGTSFLVKALSVFDRLHGLLLVRRCILISAFLLLSAFGSRGFETSITRSSGSFCRLSVASKQVLLAIKSHSVIYAQLRLSALF